MVVHGHHNVTIVFVGALGVGDEVGLGDEDSFLLPSSGLAHVAVVHFDDGVELGFVL